jgi:hypothetical protein
MKVLKNPTQFINQAGQFIRPRDDQERRGYRLTATLIAFVATLALLYYFLP